jgi:S1-C subfamily serine protease
VCAGDAINITKPELAQTKQPGEQSDEKVRSGTGWLAAPGFVVTNYHVVEGRSDFMLVFGDSTMDAKVVAQDRKNDLALLKPTNYSNLPPAIPIADAPAETGSKVFTIGYPNPGLMGSNQKVTNGIISAQTGLQDDPRVYQTTVALQSGNSGGPLVNSQGRVVGITTSVLDAAKIFRLTGNLPQNVNYAIKAQYLSPLLSSVESPPRQIETIDIRDDSSLEELVDDIGQSVVIIVSEK